MMMMMMITLIIIIIIIIITTTTTTTESITYLQLQAINILAPVGFDPMTTYARAQYANP